MEGLIMAGQLILALSILVGVHEWGHYITARMFKIRVEKFYIFFDFLFPLPNVLNFALWKKKKGDTEFGLGWFPLGGYVKIAGMMDESMDKEQLKLPPKPDEFRAKPAWQRLIVMMGGIIVNIIVGVIIFIGYTWYTGDEYIPASSIEHGIVAGDLGKKIGLQSGDKIINVNGEPLTRLDQAYSSEVFLGSDAFYTVERNGKQLTVAVPNNLMGELSKMKKNNFIEPLPRIKDFYVKKVQEKSLAQKAGLQNGDIILRVNDQKITYFDEFQQALQNNKLKTIKLTVLRNKKTVDLQAEVSDAGTLGFTPGFSEVRTQKRDYTFGEAVIVGTSRAFNVIFDNIRGFGKIFRGEIAAQDALSGPVGIAKIFGSEWDWLRFWYITGMLSMVLAFMNFLPIPALDGGHVIFLLYEIIARKPAPEKVIETAQQIGMILLLGLMAFALINDAMK